MRELLSWQILIEIYSQSVFPIDQRTDYSKMLVFWQAVFLPPSPSPSPPIFLLSPVFSFELVQHATRNQSCLTEFSTTASYTGYIKIKLYHWLNSFCLCYCATAFHCVLRTMSLLFFLSICCFWFSKLTTKNEFLIFFKNLEWKR